MNLRIELPDDYLPSEDEPYMNARQIEFFRRKLLDWREEIMQEAKNTVENLRRQERTLPDIADQAAEDLERNFLLRTRDRQRKLLSKINHALERIENGGFGYCEVTGRPISLKRLLARPVAVLCLEAQEQHEKNERSFRPG
ncbi:MAG: RNA polymerase-binding protein DksA [Rhodobacteraceae bacterium]|nr:RNA polymerase-binding protein DksA [Paracoccaceae bacterium]